MQLTVPCVFDHVRGLLCQVVGETPADLADRIPPGCRNDLRWQLGHTILSAESLILGLAGEALAAPVEWRAWFARETSPGDFVADTPTWPDLRSALDTSTAALLKRLETLDPDETLSEPFAPRTAPIRIETRGGLVAMATWHEGLHLGQIMSYRNVLGKGLPDA